MDGSVVLAKRPLIWKGHFLPSWERQRTHCGNSVSCCGARNGSRLEEIGVGVMTGSEAFARAVVVLDGCVGSACSQGVAAGVAYGEQISKGNSAAGAGRGARAHAEGMATARAGRVSWLRGLSCWAHHKAVTDCLDDWARRERTAAAGKPTEM